MINNILVTFGFWKHILTHINSTFLCRLVNIYSHDPFFKFIFTAINGKLYDPLFLLSHTHKICSYYSF